MIAFLDSSDYEDALRKAISLGGDADALACITGGIAEAYDGGVPPAIEKQVWELLDVRLQKITNEFRSRYVKKRRRRPSVDGRLCYDRWPVETGVRGRGEAMKAEDYQTQMDDIEGWKVNVVTYRIGEKCYCQIDNVSPGARIACAEGATREEAEMAARADTARRLARHRGMEV